MNKESMIKVLRYKAEHIKTHIKPEFFLEVAEALDKVKQAREEISENVFRYSGSGNEITQSYCDGLKASLEILDKLIESEDK